MKRVLFFIHYFPKLFEDQRYDFMKRRDFEHLLRVSDELIRGGN
jgi:transposase